MSIFAGIVLLVVCAITCHEWDGRCPWQIMIMEVSVDLAEHSCSPNRRIVVYTFCLINISLSLSDDANKIETLNIERA